MTSDRQPFDFNYDLNLYDCTQNELMLLAHGPWLTRPKRQLCYLAAQYLAHVDISALRALGDDVIHVVDELIDLVMEEREKGTWDAPHERTA